MSEKQQHLRWVSNCMRGHESRWQTPGTEVVIGPPKPTERYDTHQLAEFGLVGVYVVEDE